MTTVYESEFIPVLVKHTPFILSLLAMLSSYLFYNSFTHMAYLQLINDKLVRNWYAFFNKKWLFDLIYNKVLVTGIFAVGYKGTFKSIDRGFLEVVGSTGARNLALRLSELSVQIQSGFIYNYVSLLVLGLVMVLGFYIFNMVAIFSYLFILVGFLVSLSLSRSNKDQ